MNAKNLKKGIMKDDSKPRVYIGEDNTLQFSGKNTQTQNFLAIQDFFEERKLPVCFFQDSEHKKKFNRKIASPIFRNSNDEVVHLIVKQILEFEQKRGCIFIFDQFKIDQAVGQLFYVTCTEDQIIRLKKINRTCEKIKTQSLSHFTKNFLKWPSNIAWATCLGMHTFVYAHVVLIIALLASSFRNEYTEKYGDFADYNIENDGSRWFGSSYTPESAKKQQVFCFYLFLF